MQDAGSRETLHDFFTGFCIPTRSIAPGQNTSYLMLIIHLHALQHVPRLRLACYDNINIGLTHSKSDSDTPFSCILPNSSLLYMLVLPLETEASARESLGHVRACPLISRRAPNTTSTLTWNIA